MVAIMINEFLKLTVKSSGAEMISIRNCISNKEYLWQGDPNFWARRAPVLFPIVGKVKNNQYKFEGENYQLPQHGFARNMHFELIDKVENSLTYVLKNDDETAKVYPFKFELYIKYSLEDNKVIVSYEVKNTDSKTIWFVLGAHPAFNCPMEKNEKFTDYYLEFEKSETVSTKILSDGLVTDKETALLVNQQTLPLSKELFDNDALILENLKSRLVTLKSYKSTHQVTMDFTGFPYLGVWSKSGGAPFVCLEPWMGIADNANFDGDFTQKTGVKSLSKGNIFKAEYTLEFN